MKRILTITAAVLLAACNSNRQPLVTALGPAPTASASEPLSQTRYGFVLSNYGQGLIMNAVAPGTVGSAVSLSANGTGENVHLDFSGYRPSHRLINSAGLCVMAPTGAIGAPAVFGTCGVGTALQVDGHIHASVNGGDQCLGGGASPSGGTPLIWEPCSNTPLGPQNAIDWIGFGYENAFSLYYAGQTKQVYAGYYNLFGVSKLAAYNATNTLGSDGITYQPNAASKFLIVNDRGYAEFGPASLNTYSNFTWFAQDQADGKGTINVTNKPPNPANCNVDCNHWFWMHSNGGDGYEPFNSSYQCGGCGEGHIFTAHQIGGFLLDQNDGLQPPPDGGIGVNYQFAFDPIYCDPGLGGGC